MLKSIKAYCQGCEECQRAKIGPRDKASLDPIEAAYPRQVVSVYIIMVFIDLFSKYCESFSLRDMKAETVAREFYEKIVMRHGPPERLLSDSVRNREGN